MKKNNRLNKILIICTDFLILPFLYLCRYLSRFMLDFMPDTCMYAKFGAKCVTCGGTHFVNELSKGNLLEAFNHNQFLFLLMIFFIVAFIFLNIYILFNSKVAKKVLSIMFCLKTLYIIVGVLVVFLFLRNIPFYKELFISIKNLLKM